MFREAFMASLGIKFPSPLAGEGEGEGTSLRLGGPSGSERKKYCQACKKAGKADCKNCEFKI